MIWFVFKALLSGAIIAVVSELARRSAALGALAASLPLVSVIGMVWIWSESGDKVRLADHAEATFWYVLPSLPMFLLIPVLLRSGFGFYVSLIIGCSVTVVLYLVMIWLAARLGIKL